MNLSEELKNPSYTSKPDFVTGKIDKKKFFHFDCSCCEKKIEIEFKRQIDFSWEGKTDLISDQELVELKRYYGIGFSQKSHDGGQPVFDRVECQKCKQDFITYCGVREISNSTFSIHVQGILRM